MYMDTQDGPRDGNVNIKFLELENRLNDLERRFMQFESKILTDLATSEAKLNQRITETSYGPEERESLNGLRKSMAMMSKDTKALGSDEFAELAETIHSLREGLTEIKKHLTERPDKDPSVDTIELANLKSRVDVLSALKERVDGLVTGGDGEREALSQLKTLRNEVKTFGPTINKAFELKEDELQRVHEMRTLFEALRLRLDKVIQDTPSPKELDLRFSKFDEKLKRMDSLGGEIEVLKKHSADPTEMEAVGRVVKELAPITERLSRMEATLNKRMDEVLSLQVQVRELREQIKAKQLSEIKDQVVALDDSLADLKEGVTGLGD